MMMMMTGAIIRLSTAIFRGRREVRINVEMVTCMGREENKQLAVGK